METYSKNINLKVNESIGKEKKSVMKILFNKQFFYMLFLAIKTR